MRGRDGETLSVDETETVDRWSRRVAAFGMMQARRGGHFVVLFPVCHRLWNAEALADLHREIRSGRFEVVTA